MSREDDEFERIKLSADLERFQLIASQYAERGAEYHRRIADTKYELGRLDERLK